MVAGMGIIPAIMKKIYHTVLLSIVFATILSAFTCYNYPDYEDEDHHYILYFKNCSDKSIVIWSDKDCYWYNNPCTMYLSYEKLWRYDNEGVNISPGEMNGKYTRHDGYYENWLEDGDSMYIAVFDAERIHKNDSLRFLASYLLSLEDLQKVNFHLTYPPNEGMKDFHMWPPHNEIAKKESD